MDKEIKNSVVDSVTRLQNSLNLFLKDVLVRDDFGKARKNIQYSLECFEDDLIRIEKYLKEDTF